MYTQNIRILVLCMPVHVRTFKEGCFTFNPRNRFHNTRKNAMICLPPSGIRERIRDRRAAVIRRCQNSPFTAQMRLIQYSRNDQRGISHARRTYSTDVDVWFAGGGFCILINL